MTWQESLRQLDARLAKGEIGAAEYRKSRDEILAEASSGSGAAAEQRREDLWAAADRKAVAAEEAAAAETTLVVRMPPVEDGETTQVVAVDDVPAEPAPEPTPRPTPRPVPRSASAQAPPNGVRPAPHRSAPIEGQEVFAGAGPGRANVLVRVLVALLALAVVAAGVWWFALRDSDETTSARNPPPISAEQSASTADIESRLPELPGRANADNGTMSLERARELELFTPTYAAMLADNGSSEIVYRGAQRPGVGYLLVASPIPPANGADGVAVLTSEHLQRAGFAPAEAVSPDDPPVITRTDEAFRTFIAVYSSGDVWVQFNASGPPDGDEAALRTEFQKVLESLTERLPAD